MYIDTAERMKIIAARINEGRDTFGGASDAWHKLGNVTGKYMTWEEAAKAGGADFQVIKERLEFMGVFVDAWGTFRVDLSVPKGLEKKAIRRTLGENETEYLTMLGNVGEGYEPIQQADGFRLLDGLVGSINGAHYETVGTLDFGRIVWGQVNPNISIRVGDDESKVYLTFQTSHDGSKATEVYETGTRVVCRNTFRMAQLKKLGQRLRVKHTRNAAKRMENWQAELEEIQHAALDTQDKLVYLANKKVTKVSLTNIMDKLFPKKQTDEGEESSTRRDNILAAVLQRYDDNDGNVFPEQRGTAYNLWNAVTGYVDHDRSSKGDQRAESATFGSGATMKANALQMILDEAEDMPRIQESVEIPAGLFSSLG
jgi:phage/plasmid-like protein (TIGR03299 family)